MDEIKNTEDVNQYKDNTKAVSESAHVATKPWARTAAVAAIPATLAAWGVYFFNGDLAMVLGCIALILAVLGIRLDRGCLRDLTITCIIASFVLVTVYAIFRWVLPGLL